MLASRLALDEMEASTRFVSHQPVACRFASQQTEEGAPCDLLSRSERHDAAAPRNTAHSRLAAGNLHTRLSSERLRDELDVLEDPSRSESDRDAMVENGHHRRRPTLFISEVCRHEREGIAVAVDSIEKRRLNARDVRQVADRALDIQQRTVWAQVEKHFEERGSGNETAHANALNAIPIDVDRVFDVDGDAELAHQRLRRQIDRPRTEDAQGCLAAVSEQTGEFLSLG
jgi:hypothetical protein